MLEDLSDAEAVVSLVLLLGPEGSISNHDLSSLQLLITNLLFQCL